MPGGRVPGQWRPKATTTSSSARARPAACWRTEDRDTTVLVLEAGGWDRDPWIHIPLAWGKILTHRLHDWMYFTEPEPNLAGRRIECARGKVIGGSSSLKA